MDARKEAVSWYIDHAKSTTTVDAASDLEARLHKAAELEAARKAIAESECMTRAVYARCLRVLLDTKGKAVKYYQPQHSQDDEAEADWLYSMGQKLMAASQAPPGAV